jgi:hypothetical protein
VVSARRFHDVLTVQGGDRVILCAMVRRRAQQAVQGIVTDCSSICIVDTGKKSPPNLLTRSQSNPGNIPTSTGLERNGYSTPVQIDFLFPTSCVTVQADGIGTIPLSTRDQG